MHRIWLSTMYTFCCSANSSTSLIIYFNNDKIVQECSTKIYIQTPCVTVLILSECTNSLCETIRTALGRTAPHIINLDPLLSTLCNGSSSPRVYEQHESTVRTALSRTAPHNIQTSLLQVAVVGISTNKVTSYWCSIHYTTH